MTERARVLLVEDDDVLGPSLRHRFALEGFDPLLATSAREAMAALRRHGFAAIVSDIRLPDGDGESLYRAAIGLLGRTPILFVTAHGDVEQAVRLIKAGADDYLTKPFDVATLVARVRALLPATRGADAAADAAVAMELPAMRKLEAALQRLARTAAPVLIGGESGVGKEVLARRLHALSGRTPFVALNCAAIPAELAESTLFGHEKGAFTGATARHAGYFEEAQDGTLFLDEIGELPLPLQAKLLRALQDRRFRRVGGTVDLPFAARLVAATNADLAERAAAGSFRADLLFRIAVVDLVIPPLRERPEDVAALFARFLPEIAAEYRVPLPDTDADVASALRAHDWPGNIRELRNRIARALALGEGTSLRAADLFPERRLATAPAGEASTLETARDDAERQAIRAALRAHGGRIAATAASLGVSRVTLWTKMKRLGLSA